MDPRNFRKKEEPIMSPNKNAKLNPNQSLSKTGGARSPVKKTFNYSNPLYDRLKLR